MDPKRAAFEKSQVTTPPHAANPMVMGTPATSQNPTSRPLVGAGVVEVFPAIAGAGADLIYQPHLLREGVVHFTSAKAGVDESRNVRLVNPITADAIDWDRHVELPSRFTESQPAPDASFAELPGFAMNAENYKPVEKEFSEWLYRNERAELWFCPALKAWSNPGEPEGDFRARLLHEAHEARDAEVEKIRAATLRKLRTLESRLQTAEGTLANRKASAQDAQMKAGVSILGGILGALMGRKTGLGTLSRGTTAVNRSTTAINRSRTVASSAARVDSIRAEIADVEQEMEDQIAQITKAFDPQSLALETESLAPTRANVRVTRVALLWLPFTASGHPAW